MIPLLGVPVLNRGDLLARMIDSIDYPIDKLAIIQNGNDDTVCDVINELMTSTHPLINEVYLERPFRNIGVSQSWNTIIKAFPECSYWIITNNDTVFLPGDLEKYVILHSQHHDDLIVQPNGAFSCFLITPKIVQTVGLFDENIWPIYCEDVDYFIRMKKYGVERIPINSDLGYSNDGSWMIRSNNRYRENNNYTQASNSVYVEQKWGKDGEYQTPFNSGIYPNHWYYNPHRRADHSNVWNNFENTANKGNQK
jgi:hypothetical protein